MDLKEAFKTRMKKDLGEEYPAFLKTYEEMPRQGLRVNECKIMKEDFLALSENLFHLSSVPWCPTGFYFSSSDRPGRHVFHEAGLYYIQEPSAMSAAAVLGAKPGDVILDLCAAPGGKSSQIASEMKNEGLLVVNEIHPARAKILSQNMERMGLRNCLVMNETPQSLSAHFCEFFDKILCDAPCSGEGMFRKDENAIAEWSPEHVTMCADRQLSILLEAEKMLKPGGRLVYSTCTFAKEENEDLIRRFLDACPSMEMDPMELPYFSKTDIPGCYRLYPHKLEGEGHGLAILKKKGEAYALDYKTEKTVQRKDVKKLKFYLDWEKETLKKPLSGEFLFYGDQLYLVPENIPSLKGLKCLRPGLQLGELKGKLFKPSHALGMALTKDEVLRSYDMDLSACERYMRGDVLEEDGLKGWTLMTVSGISCGFSKAGGGQLKNHYPKGLRITWKG